jgi:hypothetical protein
MGTGTIFWPLKSRMKIIHLFRTASPEEVYLRYLPGLILATASATRNQRFLTTLIPNGQRSTPTRARTISLHGLRWAAVPPAVLRKGWPGFRSNSLVELPHPAFGRLFCLSRESWTQLLSSRNTGRCPGALVAQSNNLIFGVHHQCILTTTFSAPRLDPKGQSLRSPDLG